MKVAVYLLLALVIFLVSVYYGFKNNAECEKQNGIYARPFGSFFMTCIIAK